ncbi:hypothetical protein D9M69_547350 [compost metagenome]
MLVHFLIVIRKCQNIKAVRGCKTENVVSGACDPQLGLDKICNVMLWYLIGKLPDYFGQCCNRIVFNDHEMDAGVFR